MEIDKTLIQISDCGKYVYPVDSITGAKTFATVEYFTSKVEKQFGGSVVRFVKEYVTRDTKKYLKAGYTPEQIKEMAEKDPKRKLPKIASDNKLNKEKKIRKPRKKRALASLGEVKQVVINEEGQEEIIKVYPWSNDPINYFRSQSSKIDIAEATTVTCLRPDVYLDADCDGCPYYEKCTCKLKV